MSPLQLVASFQANIQIQDADHILYQKNCFSSGEVQEFINKHGKSKIGWSLLRGSVIPLRSDNPIDFAKDLFLPTFINYSLKIHNFALKIFASIFAIVFDAVLFPIRLVATPFRVHYNQQNPEEIHPIISLIKNHPQAKQDFENNTVILRYEVQKIEMNQPTNENGDVFQNAKKTVTTGTIQVALKRLPGGIKENSSEETENSTFLSINGEWVQEGFEKTRSSHYHFSC